MSDINPKHYEINIGGRIFQVADLMEAQFPHDVHLSQALKYLLRAGRKTRTSYIQDVSKCLWWCARAIIFHGGTHVELPPGVRTAPAKKRPKSEKATA